MKKQNIIQAIGGLSIMLSVFAMLTIVQKTEPANKLATTILQKNTAPISRQNSQPSEPNKELARTINGTFDPNLPGEVIKNSAKNSGEKIHYKKISETLIQKNKSAKLFLEISDGSQTEWREILEATLENGSILFPYRTNDTLNDNYTGNYRIIIK